MHNSIRITRTLTMALISAVAACGSDDPTPAPRATATPVPLELIPTAPSQPATAPTATPAPDEFVLNMSSPAELESVTTATSITVAGQTRVDAALSVNDAFVEPDANGRFSLVVDLVEGPNVIEVVASIASGEELSRVITVISIAGG